MKTLIALVSLLTFNISAAESISLDKLGALNLDYQNIKQVSGFDLKPVPAQVSYLPGAAYQITAPFRPQQIDLLVSAGSEVTQDQRLLRLSGSEVHHFQSQYQSQKALYDLASQRYQNNLELMKNKQISASQWQQIVIEYQQQKMALAHFRHFNELVETTNSDDQIYLKAPQAGVYLPPANFDQSESLYLGEILATDALRLKFSLPTLTAISVSSVSSPLCELTVDRVEQDSDGYFVKIWSEPLKSECQLLPGQQIKAIPHYQNQAYQVPKSSLFDFQGQTQILVKENSVLTTRVVSVINGDKDHYFLKADKELSGLAVLTDSVAAVKGILLGMGGE
jgi:hypothetical protein